ncbi:hypothetical protein CHS0354_026355 [Potamilus streckersoni]|uniref:Mitochondria-eating protein C-terminal domain-containing protein n=1 Tax=Potamilus streckersoni TaxID=2493646 RepID=A0AAE0W791_9BIVA|nr:hypothetical protein CHS0354_026355 [Potamilus streckersoni]
MLRLFREIELYKDENTCLQALLHHLHEYISSGTEAKDTSFELPSEIQPGSTKASSYKTMQDIWKKFKEMKGCHRVRQMHLGESLRPDISDQNELANLGNRYSHLYENEWLNGFEVLTSKFHTEEKSAIELLRQILLECYKNAFEMSEMQMMKAEHVLSGSSERDGQECARLLKEARKNVELKKDDDLFKGFINKALDTSIGEYMKETAMMLFAKECFQLCWLMSIQDPQVVFAKNPDHGDHFNTNMYKHYTISGDEVDYIVWPAVLLHEKGPLLVQGVAQPIPGSKTSSTSAPVADRYKDILDFTQHEGSVQNMTSPADKSRQDQGIDDRGSAVEDNYNQSATRSDSTPTKQYQESASTADTTLHSWKPNATFLHQEQTLRSHNDTERFKTFCKVYKVENHESFQRCYGQDFDRYYNLYIKLYYGMDNTA